MTTSREAHQLSLKNLQWTKCLGTLHDDHYMVKHPKSVISLNSSSECQTYMNPAVCMLLCHCSAATETQPSVTELIFTSLTCSFSLVF